MLLVGSSITGTVFRSMSCAHMQLSTVVCCSSITFKDGGALSAREYETETKMECAEIVAKLRFLMQHQDGSPNSAVAESSLS